MAGRLVLPSALNKYVISAKAEIQERAVRGRTLEACVRSHGSRLGGRDDVFIVFRIENRPAFELPTSKINLTHLGHSRTLFNSFFPLSRSLLEERAVDEGGVEDEGVDFVVLDCGDSAGAAILGGVDGVALVPLAEHVLLGIEESAAGAVGRQVAVDRGDVKNGASGVAFLDLSRLEPAFIRRQAASCAGKTLPAVELGVGVAILGGRLGGRPVFD